MHNFQQFEARSSFAKYIFASKINVKIKIKVVYWLKL